MKLPSLFSVLGDFSALLTRRGLSLNIARDEEEKNGRQRYSRKAAAAAR